MDLAQVPAAAKSVRRMAAGGSDKANVVAASSGAGRCGCWENGQNTNVDVNTFYTQKYQTLQIFIKRARLLIRSQYAVHTPSIVQEVKVWHIICQQPCFTRLGPTR